MDLDELNIQLPLIRRAIPAMIAADLVGVQPMIDNGFILEKFMSHEHIDLLDLDLHQFIVNNIHKIATSWFGYSRNEFGLAARKLVKLMKAEKYLVTHAVGIEITLTRKYLNLIKERKDFMEI